VTNFDGGRRGVLRLIHESLIDLGPAALRVAGRPLKEASSGLGAQVTALDHRHEVRMWNWCRVDVGHQNLVYGESQIRPPEVGLFQWSNERQAPSKTVTYHQIDRLSGADAAGDQGNGLTLEGVLHSIADDTRHVDLHVNRDHVRRRQDLHCLVHDVGRRRGTLNDLDERNEVGRVPEMGADDS
jgi:hypothetical protein